MITSQFRKSSEKT